MNILKKITLIGAISAAIVGCDDDYSPEQRTENSKPQERPNIIINMHETDGFRMVHLLGNENGEIVNSNNAPLADRVYDPDGDFLIIKDFEPAIETNGFELVQGSMLAIRTAEFAREVHSGDTFTRSFDYKISDGREYVTRTVTINVEGVDSAPTFTGGLRVAISKFVENGTESFDLLSRVFDADGDPLTVTDFTADPDNEFSGIHSLTENTLNINLTSVLGDIPDGAIFKQYYTYKLEDTNQRKSETRTIELNILGVRKIPGAPVFTEYFVEKTYTEGESATIIDMAEGAIDSEGDPILVSNVMVNGEEFTNFFGLNVSGRFISVNPLTFMNKLAPGEEEEYEFTYFVEDDQGNRADGFRTLTLKIQGAETNILAANGVSTDFEGPEVTGITTIGACNFSLGSTDPKFGSSYLQIDSEPCTINMDQSILPTFEYDQEYIFTYWFRNNKQMPPYVLLSESEFGTDYWTAGRNPAPDSVVVDEWIYSEWMWNTNEGRLFNQLAVTGELMLIMQNKWQPGNNGTPAYDELKLVRVDQIDPLLNDLIGNTGLFENNAYEPFIDNTIGGIAEVNAEAAATPTFDVEALEERLGTVFDEFSFEGFAESIADLATVSNSGLLIDTSDKLEAGSTVVVRSGFDLPQGAIQSGGRYIFEFDAKHANTAGTPIWFTIRITSESAGASIGKVFSIAGDPANNQFEHKRLLLTESLDATAEGIDWGSLDDLTVEIVTPADNARIYIDNLVLYTIP